MQKLLMGIALIAVALSGCATEDNNSAANTPDMPDALPTSTNVTELAKLAAIAGLEPMVLVESVVDAAVDMTGDLYEPTMDVCDDGSIYITGHTIAVDTTGAPVFGSHDNGATWSQLPWFQDQTLPSPLHGATPPVTDEIFLACGDDGYLYGSDITLATYPVNAWSGYGTSHEYWNFNAYDETLVAQQAQDCIARPAKDRPWAAYNNGTLLLTSNPAGAENQIGVVDVPFASPAPWSLGTVIDGIDWNLCAGPGGSIPGVPDISDSGMIAAPQLNGGALWLTVGHKSDIMGLENVRVFETSTIGEITSVYGHAVFDGDDTLFVGITNNTREEYACENGGILGTGVGGGPATCVRPNAGGMQFAVSQDEGESFTLVNFTSDRHLVHFYMDGNKFGEGALVTWAHVNETSGYDWYMGHLLVGDDGMPYMTNVFEVISNGPAPSAHVTGAAVGPDGRAYTAMYTTRAGTPAAPTTPMSVYIQESGPTMPVFADAALLVE